jgi:uncharacterized membrane protein
MLATLTNIPASMAHNLMTSLIFSLAAVGAYGVVYTLLVKTHKQETAEHEARSSSVGLSLLAPLFLLLVSNFGALLEVLYRYGIFWKKDAAGQFVSPFWTWLKNIDKSNSIWNPNVTTYNFWTWLNVKELNMPPAEPLGWLEAQRYLWWWRSSRLLQDYDMKHNPLEVIDEFPFFSFLLGDLRKSSRLAKQLQAASQGSLKPSIAIRTPHHEIHVKRCAVIPMSPHCASSDN